MARLEEFRAVADYPEEVEIALWYHDAIYKPRSASNELDSAFWASRFLSEHGVDSTRCARIHSHILATRHNDGPSDGDAGFVVDIDLSILGRTEEEYARFERDVRQEYVWVPSILFKRKRREILQSFLDRDAIYNHNAIREVYESAARKNLKAAIAELSI